MAFIEDMTAQLGPGAVLTGAETAPWQEDWTGKFTAAPAAVLRPRNTEEVSLILKAAHASGTPIVPVSGNTGLNGGAVAREGEVQLCLDRMDRIREIRTDARIAVVEAGVIQESLHRAAEDQGLVFPMTFGAKGSARIGGMLSTNAGGSNVLRYGNMRQLCLGVEAVLADGRIVNLMSELHKDNSGYDLRDLLIGAEGTLGVITAAVLRLAPLPRAYATAMVATRDLPAALTLLRRLQDETGGQVEACEYMPGSYFDFHAERFPQRRPPFDTRYETNILVEVAATSDRDAAPGPDGALPVTERLEAVLARAMEEGLVLDATLARSHAQRREMWERREAAGELMVRGKPLMDTDIALPLDKVPDFFDRIAPRRAEIDPEAEELIVAHLGDGNIHYALYPTRDDPVLMDRLREAVEEVTVDLGGSFSAEHGIGLSKMPSMSRRKDPVALSMMRAIKTALDPKGILNPGKVVPSE